MFDVEQAVADWRRQMLAAGIKSPAPLEELETHLREEIELQMRLGLTEPEAFKAAVQKIGLARTVQSEFAKVDETEQARQWNEGRIWLGMVLGSLQLILVGAVLSNSEMTFVQRISGLLAIVASCLLVAVGRWCRRIFPIIHSRGIRTTVVFVSGGVPVLVWFWVVAHFFLIAHEFPFGQWLASLIWATGPPLGAFLGLICGVEAAARTEIATSGL